MQMRNHKYFIIALNEFLNSESKQRNTETNTKPTAAYMQRLYSQRRGKFKENERHKANEN